MLPFRTDAIMTPLVQFSPMTPPAVPMVQCPREIQYIVPAVAAAVANEFGARAMANSARIFCYNLISHNNYQNPDFAEAVKIVMDLMTIELFKRRAYPSPEQALPDCVGRSVSMYVSKKLFEFQELKALAPPAIVDGAMQNYGMLMNLTNEINTLYNQGPQQQQQMPLVNNQVQQHQGAMYPHYQQPQNYFQANNQPLGRPMTRFDNLPQSPQPTVAFGVGDPLPSFTDTSNNPVRQDRFFAKAQELRQAQARQPEMVTTAPTHVPLAVTTQPVLPVSVDKTQWTPSVKNPYRTLTLKSCHNVEFIMQNGNVVESITTTGEDTMDRSLHSTGLLSNTYQLKPERLEELGEHVEVLKSIKITDYPTETSETPNPIHEYIQDDVWLDMYLESAIFECRLKKYRVEKQKGKNGMIYRCFSTIARSFITDQNYRHLTEELHSQRTFAGMAQKLRALGQAATTSEAANDGTSAIDLVIFCQEIDNYLTDVINDFITNKLSITTLTIDSFTEDVEGLGAYLNTKYSYQYAAALQRFESDTVRYILRPIEPEYEKTISDQLNMIVNSKGEEQPEKMDLIYSHIPVRCSMTYIDVLEKELKLAIEPGESLLIRRDMTPLLYDIAESLFRQKPDAIRYTFYDYLITRDNVVFKLHQGYMSHESYLISK